MKNFLWSSSLHTIDAAKQKLKRSEWLRSSALARYTYLFDITKAIVVPELNLVFVPTPKVANRSMKAAIALKLNPEFRGDPHKGWQYTPIPLIRRNDFFRFGFVRNPLDRLLSCYAQKVVKYMREMGMPSEFWRYGESFYPEMSFSDFVHRVAEIPDRLSDIHFRSQHTYFYHRGDLMVDFVGRYEQLEQDWNVVQSRFDFVNLPHYNPSSHRDYREEYTPELARIAAARYRKDIELFGYTDEINCLLK